MSDSRCPMIKAYRSVPLVVALVFLSACTDVNEHFCSKYQYYYNELTAPGILPLRDIRAQLKAELAKKTKVGYNTEKTRTMLLVLDDLENDLIGEGREARAFCMRMERWQKI